MESPDVAVNVCSSRLITSLQ